MGTDPGIKRGYNQDAVGKQEPSDARQLRSRGALYILADGVGGGPSGEVASQVAVRATIQEYYSAPPSMDNARSLRQAIVRANSEVYRQSQENPEWQGMATTIVAIVAQLDGRLIVANAGDSRAYLVRNSQPTIMSEQHSWVAEQVAAGILTVKQAKTHRRRHQITRSLGRRPTVEVAVSTHEMLKNDIVVLCSDGITDVIEDHEIVDAVRDGDLQAVVSGLIDLANSRGGPDNISVLIVRYPQVEAARAARAPRKPSRVGLLAAGGVVVVLAVAAIVVVALSRQRAAAPSASAAVQSPTVEAPPTQEEPTPSLESVEVESPTLVSAVTQPTATPSETPSPTEETERRATATLMPTPEATNTPSPTATPARYGVAPELTEPGDEQWMLSDTTTLKWTFPYTLKANEQFEIRIWKQGQAGNIIERVQSTEKSYDYKMPSYDNYEWTVVVVRKVSEGTWVEVSDPAAVRAFYYAEPEKPADGKKDDKPKPTTRPPTPVK